MHAMVDLLSASIYLRLKPILPRGSETGRLKYDERRVDSLSKYVLGRVLFLTNLLRAGDLASLKHRNSA